MNAPKASAREQKLANKFELYWEQTVLLCPCSLIYCSASVAWWQGLVSSLKWYSCPCFEGMSISFHLSPPLKRFPSYPVISSDLCEAQLFKLRWEQSAALPFSCKQKGVTLPSQIFPLPCVLTVTWNLPSLLIRLWQACSSLPLCTLCIFLHVCAPRHGLQGRKRKYVMVWGGEMLFKQFWGLQDTSWPEVADLVDWDEYSRSLPSSSIRLWQPLKPWGGGRNSSRNGQI